jgi:lantibiotic transport system permease protein
MTFLASFRSELLKTKRTSLFYMMLITALIIPFVFAFDHATSDSTATKNAWNDFYLEGIMIMIFAFLPLFLILASTLLIQIEVRNNTWKQVLASPQLFFDILLAKFAVLQLLGLGFIVVYNLYFILSASVVDFVADTNFISYLQRWPEVLSLNARAYGSTIGISALCFWLAIRSKSFVAPIGIGLALWLGTIAALEFHWSNIDLYVFALPFTVVAKKYQDQQTFHQLLSIAYGLVFFVGAYLEFVIKRTSVGRTFRRLFSPKSEMLSDHAAKRVSH